MAKTLKVAMIGVGGIARTHMPGWAASEHAEVVAGADISEKALTAWGADHKVSKLVTKPEDIFSDPDIDIVDLCVPNMHHAPLAIAALNAGKHVICENKENLKQLTKNESTLFPYTTLFRSIASGA